MTAHSRLETRPIFMPIVGNFLKGLSVTVPLQLAEARRGTTAEHMHAALAERYMWHEFGDSCLLLPDPRPHSR